MPGTLMPKTGSLLGRSTLGLCALGLAGLATPALAQEGDARQLAVPFKSRDLATPRGRASIEWRLARAAEWVCGVERDGRAIYDPSPEQQVCIAHARDAAMAKLAAKLDDRRLASRQ